MNTTNKVSEAGFHAEPLPFKVTKIFLYTTILLFGTVGNTVVILIICKFKHMKKTPGNYFILNLAMCDLLTPMISIPLDLYLVESNYRWHLGAEMCKVLQSVTTFIATNSSLTLAVISLDRYRTLMHPFKRRLDDRTVKILIAFVHLCSGILIIPIVVTMKLSPSGYCGETWPNDVLPKIYTFVLFLGQYVLPLTVMAIMYVVAAKNLFATTKRARLMSLNSNTSAGKRSISGSRNGSLSPNEVNGPREDNSHESLERHFRKESEHNAQVTKMFILIVIVFAIVTLPLEILWIWADFGGGKTNPYYAIIAVTCRLFTYSNCCINPVIFYKFSRDFHRGFIAFFNGNTPCCGDNSFFRRVPVGFSTLERNGITDGARIRKPYCPSPRGSFLCNHSTSSTDKVKMCCDSNMEHKLCVPRFEQSCDKSLTVKMFNRISINKEKAYLGRDFANSLHSSVLTKSMCTEKLLNRLGDVTIELDKLESLAVLQQTDC